jgi:curli biogenesis system outer membrane secretion channel CsgG
VTLLISILTIALLQAASPTQPAPGASAGSAQSSVSRVEPTPQEKLRGIKRIFVESFGDDAISKQLNAFVISALTDSKRFIVTENRDKADAILKGTGLEKTSKELHSYSDSTAAGGFGASADHFSAAAVGRSAAIEDSSTNTETINEARAAVRLVDRDGDVIWTAAQESKGAKYKGAAADVAEHLVKQLLRDLEKAEKAIH